MRVPIPELITQNLESALRGIRRNAGYSFNIAVVERRLTENTPDCDAILSPDSATMADYEPYPLARMVITYNCFVYIRGEEDDNTTPDAQSWTRWADVCRAVMADQSRGNIAERTSVGAPTFMEDGVNVPITVTCRFSMADPTKEAP